MTARPSEAERAPRNRSQQLLLGLGALVLAALPHGIPEFYTGLVTSGLIAAMLALSLQLLVGCTGLVSLGHAAFYGLGAYTVYAITPADHSLSILASPANLKRDCSRLFVPT